MPSDGFLRSLIDLAACETLDALLDATSALIESELGLQSFIEFWNADGDRFTRGTTLGDDAHRTWVGIRYTLGAIHVTGTSIPTEELELLACQLAPLAERLIDHTTAQRRTIRDDIAMLYERRIRDALVRFDWNASAVARELAVGRARVARVVRRWRRT